MTKKEFISLVNNALKQVFPGEETVVDLYTMMKQYGSSYKYHHQFIVFIGDNVMCNESYVDYGTDEIKDGFYAKALAHLFKKLVSYKEDVNQKEETEKEYNQTLTGDECDDFTVDLDGLPINIHIHVD